MSYPTKNEVIDYLSKSEYEKDRAVLLKSKQLFCSDIDYLLDILNFKEKVKDEPRLSALFSNLVDVSMEHLYIISEHTKLMNENTKYILNLIKKELGISLSLTQEELKK